MSTTYSNCKLNIAASCAARSEDGFFASRDRDPFKPLRFKSNGVVVEANQSYPGYGSVFWKHKHLPITKRAWILQERLLSVLLFLLTKWRKFVFPLSLRFFL